MKKHYDRLQRIVEESTLSIGDKHVLFMLIEMGRHFPGMLKERDTPFCKKCSDNLKDCIEEQVTTMIMQRKGYK